MIFLNLLNFENSRLGRKRLKESKQIRIPKTADFSRVALTNAKISGKSAQGGRRFRRPSKPTKSTVFRILTETNMNSLSTKSTKRNWSQSNTPTTSQLDIIVRMKCLTKAKYRKFINHALACQANTLQ